VNTGAPLLTLDEAKARDWGSRRSCTVGATAHAGRRSDDLFNLVTDPAFVFLRLGTGADQPWCSHRGVDGSTAYYIRQVRGEALFRSELPADLGAGEFVPLPVLERMIPKSGAGCAGWVFRACGTGSPRRP
jgi:RNA-directed DNA polymerase